MRALLAQHDIVSAHKISQLLRNHGFIVDQAEDGEETVDMARHYDYDVVVLDMTLSDMAGVDVVRRMRTARIETPVLILSEMSSPQARVKALSAGADDVISKPFDRDELIARLQTIVRRSRGFSQAFIAVGPLKLNLQNREVMVCDRAVHLTGKEYAILELLALRKGICQSKDAILNHLYGGTDEPEAKIIDVFVCKLRKKIAQAGAPELIGTVWGRGYILRDPSTANGGEPAIDRADVRELLEVA
jgi:two-component system, cell cycle response regulator CtrA